jgi:glycosyltransferase involved in cell wall biosynthesis
MRVAIDARAAAEEPGGRGTYVRELVCALPAAAEPDDRFLLLAREPWDGAPDGLEWVTLSAPDPLWHVLAARHADRHADVLLSTNSYLTAWFARVPCAVVVHDLIPFLPAMRPRLRSTVIERATAPLGVRRAAALICDSASTAHDLVARFPAADGKTSVVLLAADARFSAGASDVGAVLDGHGVKRPYLLSVGTLEPRKNLPRLIEAAAGRRLVLVGARGWEAGEIEAAARAADTDVALLGRVGDDELVALYQGAEAFCYPSLYEGFGLPVLEALAAGVPVVTSNVSSLPEVAGDAAVLVDPLDVGSIRAGIDEALRRAEELRAAGPRQAAGFSWERTARETLSVLRSLCAG